MAEPKTLLVLMGNQLFAEPLLRVAKADAVFMSEEDEFCQHVPYHQHKLVLILAGMRAQRDALRAKAYTVHYSELEQEDSRSYEEKLLQVLQDGDYEQLAYFEIEGRAMARRMAAFADAHHTPSFANMVLKGYSASGPALGASPPLRCRSPDAGPAPAASCSPQPRS